MPDMLDYMDWRGDLSLSQSPFTEVDNLLLSYLAYVNLDKIAPGPDEGDMTVKKLSDRFFDTYSQKELKEDRSATSKAPEVMKIMGNSVRFQDARVMNYVNEVNEEQNLQFSAMEIRLSDGTAYIAYRGTDDTIVGWKEDFELSNGTVAAQIKAARYLDRTGEQCPCPLRVGGHSKGGNLCIYASAKCKSQTQDKIVKIYCNDGPGFTEHFLQEAGYLKIKSRILRIVPESSIIGMLLHHSVKPVVIASSSTGIFQHDGFSWQVMGAAFVRKERINKNAEQLDYTLNTWIESMDAKKRDAFIKELFSVMEVTGAKTLSDVHKDGLRDLPLMLWKFDQLDPETKEMFSSLLGDLLIHWKELI